MESKRHNLSKILFSTLLMLSCISYSSAYLSTNSRWIVSSSGDRVKFRCVNWPGHLNAMVPEGLEKQPIKRIAQKVKEMGFNCARLSWAVHMYTLDQNKNLTVEQSLNIWNLKNAVNGVRTNNPNFLTMTVADAQKAVIDELGATNLMVVLDNHVSKPMWCCGYDDGNGFFGDKFFDRIEWLKALSIVASRYRGNQAVVGMSMRNELRGPHSNIFAWYTYMQQGAELIHKQNPDVLVIVSGLVFDTNLKFIGKKPLTLSFTNKLVFESHAYAFGDPPDRWKFQTNEFCKIQTKKFFDLSGFLINNYPLIISEFGVDLKVEYEMEKYFLACTMAYFAEYDLDWAMWALQGSYMVREGQQDMEEEYGILSKDWGSVRNSNMLQKLQLAQQINFDPKSTQSTYYKMFHPHTGMCVQADTNNVFANDCRSWAKWTHTRYGSPIKLSDGRCLLAMGEGLPVSISNDCSNVRAAWNLVSFTKLHVASKDEHGNSLCLEMDDKSNKIVTRKCLCMENNYKDFPLCGSNVLIQWFKLVPSNI